MLNIALICEIIIALCIATVQYDAVGPYLSQSELDFCCKVGSQHLFAQRHQYKLTGDDELGELCEVPANQSLLANGLCRQMSKVCCLQRAHQVICESLSSELLLAAHSYDRQIPRPGLCSTHPECCECCELGIRARRTQSFEHTIPVCASIEYVVGRSCGAVFQDCCFKLNLSAVSRRDPRCSKGFVWSPESEQCLDIDECSLQLHNCSNGYRCENTRGAFKCIRERNCGTGYNVQHDTQGCVDIDECITGTHNCGRGMLCQNLPGTFKCIEPSCEQNKTKFDPTQGRCVHIRCQPGYKLDSDMKCRDINECADNKTICAYDQICRNTIGSFECVPSSPDGINQWIDYKSSKDACPKGFQLDVHKRQCQDIDECALKLDTCNETLRGSICHNLNGRYECICPTGYGEVLGQCEDVDECSVTRPSVCPDNAICINTPGSYRCQCKKGFRGHRCTEDINECIENQPCEHICENLKGSYFCLCHHGYVLDPVGRHRCLDIDECLEHKVIGAATGRNRLCRYHCINLNGSYQCGCPPGYARSFDELGLERCTDINECSKSDYQLCPYATTCVNTYGGYRCVRQSCPQNYRWISHNQCKLQSFPPFPLSRNLPTSYFFAQLALKSRQPWPTSLFLIRIQVPDVYKRVYSEPLYSLRVSHANSSDRTLQLARKNDFRLYSSVESPWEAELQTVNELHGPQDIELDLTTSFREGRPTQVLRLHSVVRLTLYVAEYEF